MATESKATTPRQFRLEQETLDNLDLIAAEIAKTHGVAATRAQAIRFAAKQAADRIRKKSGK